MFEVIKKAETRLEAEMSRESLKSNKASAIFHLKQKHYGAYQDKQTAEVNGDVAISVTIKGADGKDFDG